MVLFARRCSPTSLRGELGDADPLSEIHSCRNVGWVPYGPVMNAGAAPSGPGRRTVRDEVAELVTRIPLFLSSYLPLFVIFAVRFDRPEWLAWICAGFVVAGLLAVAAVLWALRRVPTTTVRIDSVRDAGAEAGGYLATYVLPFVLVTTPSVRDMLGFGIFMLILAVVYVRSDLIQVNPAIYLLLRRVVRVRTESEEQVFVIVRQRPRSGQVLPVRTFAGIRVATEGGS